MVWEKVPYTNLHNLDLDWIVSKIKEQEATIKNFINVSTIKYADPIQWNITKQYEANTVVIDPATGTAYISTKPVPSGIALSNTDYWTVVFDLDALFSDLEQEMSDFKSDVNTEINSFKNEINAEIDSINSRISTLSEKYFIFIGDSFGAGWTPDGDTIPYGTMFKEHYQITNDRWFESNLGGSGFAVGTTYQTQLQSLLPDIPDRSLITDIYVLGGRNDYGAAQNDIYSGKVAFINYAKANFPNAKIHIGFIGRSFEYTTNASMALQQSTFYQYKRDCELLGAFYMNGMQYCLNNSQWFASDGKHPNQNGQNNILNALISYFEKGSYEHNITIYPELVPSGINENTSNFVNISMNETDELITVTMYPFNITVNVTETAMSDKTYELGTFTAMLCPGAPYPTYETTISAILALNDGSTYFQNVAIPAFIENNKLYIRLSLINRNLSNYFNGKVIEIQFKGMNLKYGGTRGE